MRTLKALADRILVIFPFEPDIYGRPALRPRSWAIRSSSSRPRPPRAAFLASSASIPSRPVSRCCPGAGERGAADAADARRGAARIAAPVPDVQFLLARAPGLGDSLLAPLAASAVRIPVVEGRSDDVLRRRRP